MFVVTLPASAEKDPLAYAKKAKEAGANILEIRGELTSNVESFNSPLPLLVSPRGAGDEFVDRFNALYIDLELDEIKNSGFEIRDSDNGNLGTEVRSPKSDLIISYHNYEETPSVEKLESITQEILEHKPSIVKIAVHINSYADLKVLQELHALIPTDQKRIILGMGIRAHVNRMLSPWDNELTYTYIDDGDQAAEGQVSLEMYKLCRGSSFDSAQDDKLTMTQKPKLFGILGSLDVQSKSPLIHNTLYNLEGENALYCLCLTDDLEDAWNNVPDLGLQGFSVTSPYKQEIIPLLDSIDPDADALHSVNTVVNHHGSWRGYTRDPEGLLEGYPCLQNAETVSILGSGGVVPSVLNACKRAKVQNIHIFARNEKARKNLANHFSIESGPLEDAKLLSPDVLICTISADTDVPIPMTKQNAHAIDLRYGKDTKFMTAAKEAGYNVHDGLAMLYHQALAQYELCIGKPASNEHKEAVWNILQSNS